MSNLQNVKKDCINTSVSSEKTKPVPPAMEDYITTYDSFAERFRKLPRKNFFYEGIKEKSVNILVAPAKVGKSTFGENLAMCIAAGIDNYLEKKVWWGENQKVLIANYEEFYDGRGDRNTAQVDYIDKLVGNQLWHSNLFLFDLYPPNNLSTQMDWEFFIELIKKYNPAFVVIDSLSKLHGYEAIEDSTVGLKLMKRLRQIVADTGTTLLIIHHTVKIADSILTPNVMAGTRIIAQEVDAVLGMNWSSSGVKYLKPLMYRYAAVEGGLVQVFERNEHGWLVHQGWKTEAKLLQATDGRVDTQFCDTLWNYIEELTGGDESISMKTSIFMTKFVDTGITTRQTVQDGLAKLVQENLIVKILKGKYKLAPKEPLQPLHTLHEK